jgi:predicted nuclease with TOPRIM domain
MSDLYNGLHELVRQDNDRLRKENEELKKNWNVARDANKWISDDFLKLQQENALLRDSLKLAVEALENAYMSMADCASRVKAPDQYMFVDIKEALAKIKAKHGGSL